MILSVIAKHAIWPEINARGGHGGRKLFILFLVEGKNENKTSLLSQRDRDSSEFKNMHTMPYISLNYI